ncbi:MAG TPA: hypothetical protein VFY17_11090 [Pilimelia sp.]|nr:hypothetical protein [Pilimelia sp.]
MDYKLLSYLLYLAVSVAVTVWVGRTLSRNGVTFLGEVFADSRLAQSVNSLLLVGFYLLNLGFVAVALRADGPFGTAAQTLEALSAKLGLVLLVIGALHLCNVYALNRYRRARLRQSAGGTLPPAPRRDPGGAHPDSGTRPTGAPA